MYSDGWLQFKPLKLWYTSSVGTGGARGPGPPSFPKCPFSGKCPFLAWIMSFRLLFLHFWKLEFMLFPENFFNFRGKYNISGKFFGMSEKFFEMTSPPPRSRRQHFREKNFRCPFYSKSAPQSLPPPLLDASYAPVHIQTCTDEFLNSLARSLFL